MSHLGLSPESTDQWGMESKTWTRESSSPHDTEHDTLIRTLGQHSKTLLESLEEIDGSHYIKWKW